MSRFLWFTVYISVSSSEKHFYLGYIGEKNSPKQTSLFCATIY